MHTEYLLALQYIYFVICVIETMTIPIFFYFILRKVELCDAVHLLGLRVSDIRWIEVQFTLRGILTLKGSDLSLLVLPCHVA